MSLNTQNTDAISFKKLSGKAHTQQNFAVTEEGIASNVQIAYSTIFGNPIEKLPVTNGGLSALYSTNGVVERVKFEIDIIPDTQIAVGRSQGYKLKLPAGYNASGELYPQFSAGTYLYSTLGKLQIVPSLYGQLKPDGSTEYDPILYQTNGSTIITKFDAINWYLDPYNGILFVQDPPVGYDVSAARPGYVEAFLYVGDYLSDLVAQSISGNTGTSASNLGSGVGVFKTKIGNDLQFKSLVGTGGIAITGTTSTIQISYTGTTGATFSANNGLTKSGQNVRLGGTLTGDTSIAGASSSFAIGIPSGQPIKSLYVRSNNEIDFHTNNGYIKLESTAGGIQLNDTGAGSISMVSDGGSVTIEDNGGGGLNFNDVGGGSMNFNSDGGGFNFLDTATGGFFVAMNGNNSNQGIQLIGRTNAGVERTKLQLYGTGAKFVDSRTGTTARGIEYNANYSANFSPRSLVDKAYVTGLTSSITFTANNGLTKSGNNFHLGGILTGDTTIDLLSHGLSVVSGVDGVIAFNVVHGTRSSYYDQYRDVISMLVGSGITSCQLTLSSTGLTFSRDVVSSATVKYAGDYSSTYTPRSLVDKAYVLSTVASGVSASHNIYSQRVTITGNTTLTNTNFVVFCNTTLGGFTVTLPVTPVNGQVYKIKDVGNALINNILILGNGHNIDGFSSILINTQKGGVELCYDQALSAWFVMNFVG